MMISSAAAHTFVVPTHGKSPYLRECLESLGAQTRPSPIIISTSTPYDGLDVLAADHGAQLFVHAPSIGIGRDWNMALTQVDTPWVTIAHQDDVYLPEFAEQTLVAADSDPMALLIFTDYLEWVGDTPRRGGLVPVIKRSLLEFGFLGRNRVRSTIGKINCLRFGNTIPCPAVTLHQELTKLHFDERLRVNLDWAAWLDLCAINGSFIRVREKLIVHRIHPASETTNAISGGYRESEDKLLLHRMWPQWIARAIIYGYGLAYASNAR